MSVFRKTSPIPQRGEQPTVEESNEPPLDPHRPPQWLLHKHKKGEARFIFRSWPRDPAGANALEMEPGKTAPNGIVYWDATLYDFYTFQPIADLASYVWTTTGSRLAATMRKLGELNAAPSEMMWADREEEPRQFVLPIEIARDIESREDMTSDIDIYQPTGSARRQYTKRGAHASSGGTAARACH
jgi:hypothetical protein